MPATARRSKRMASPRILLLIALAALAGACAVGSAMRVQSALAAREKGDYEKSARLLLAERAAPLAPNDSTYVVSIHTLYIDVLAQWADRSGLEDWMDAAAIEAHRAGKQVPATPEDLSNLDYILAKYYTFSGRSGLALPLLYDELERRRSLGDPYGEIKALDGIASAYSDMGQKTLARATRSEMRSLAQRYFKRPGEDPSDGYEWLQYKNMLMKQLDDLVRRGRADEMRALWGEIEPIVDAVVTPEFATWSAYAELLAIDGQDAEARRALAEARRRAAREGHAGHVDLLCSEAAVEVAARNWTRADALTKRCLRDWEAQGLAPDPVKLRIRAEAVEARGDDATAMDLFARAADLGDRTRASFAVADRVAFFSQRPIRASIWGQVRTATQIAARSGADADLFAALAAAERMRARQLGDYLGRDAAASLAPAALAEIRSSLPPDTTVVAYVLTRDELVVHAFDRDRFSVDVVPLPADFEGRLRALAENLGSPRSRLAEIDRELAALGRLVLAPIGDLLEGPGRLVVIGDGVLNLIPFDLLREPAQGVSLIDGDRIVQLAPSIRLLSNPGSTSKRASEGLFAVADPIYRSSYQSLRADAASLEQGTRAIGLKPKTLFAPLPETRREVESIGRLLAPAPVTTLIGAEALESRLKSTALDGYRYIHLATHGILGNEIPGVPEPAIVLGAEDGEDGLLLVSEAMQLELDADLAVLSACKTGSGEIVSGEGVLGMSRAFLVAGSRSVVVSLWAVDSLATEALMVAFYDALRRGAAPGAALREAKRTVRAGATLSSDARGVRVVAPGSGSTLRRRHPFYWSAFVLMGRLDERN